ncbi:MAG: hypothetical protein JW884_00905 [Deltaproteobacteria bacterium]|nr:hypothetical protein [Deltaproteobacteria bacterium]
MVDASDGTKRVAGVIPFAQAEILRRDMNRLSGGQLLKRIIDDKNSRQLIQGLAIQDFYWIMKKIGEEDALPILAMSSLEQWQYVMDLEIWERDRMDEDKTAQWLKRLVEADSQKTAAWLITEEYLIYHFLATQVETEARNFDDEDAPKEGYFTLDGLFFIKVKDEGKRELIEELLHALYAVDPTVYGSIVMGIAGAVPAEIEEELYRLRNVRLAEQGFLSFEEALILYAPLDPSVLLKPDPALSVEPGPFDEGVKTPVIPLFHSPSDTFFTHLLGRINEKDKLERIGLEFAGLVNRIMAADGMKTPDYETLAAISRRLSGYVGIALEKATAGKEDRALAILSGHTLERLFRVGFGYAVDLRGKFMRWLSGSWFRRRGFTMTFWGDRWAPVLTGLMQQRPRYWSGDESAAYRDFERAAEIDNADMLFQGIAGLDGILEKIARESRVEEIKAIDPEATFLPFLFTFWANVILDKDHGFVGLNPVEARRFFSVLRSGENAPPYRMEKYRRTFIEEFSRLTPSSPALEDLLGDLWREFREEYESIGPDDLHGRFSRHIIIDDENS